jgi:orc1/cdc6 family replication initiation protein
MSLIENHRPLQPEYVPSKLDEREDQWRTVENKLGSGTLPNLFFHGTRGTGKTVLAHKALIELDTSLEGHYIPCNQYNTQYKVLQQLQSSITGEETRTGYHTSKLQREIEDQVQHTRHVVVLDELDFLLLNDGNDLLYSLSRIENSENLGLILISSNQSSLKDQVDERTYSTLQPQRISFEPYTPEQTYQILAQRARQSLQPSSLHHEALTYITSTTTNLKHALHWLHTTAQNTNQPITEETIRQHRERARQSLVNRILSKHTPHHQLLHQALQDLEQDTVRTGQAITAYREHCNQNNVEPLSNRRISDLLKHLEYYQLIQTQYHYGGTEGKTRNITPNQIY